MKKLLVVVVALFLVGCAHGGVKVATESSKPVDPLVNAKKEFKQNYGFFITKKDKVSYYQDVLGVIDQEDKIFQNIKTLEDFEKFTAKFWEVRDTDRSTPENEFKDLIDSRLEDIKKEIFSPMFRFSQNGGLTGDLAHVYMFYGKPHYEERLLANPYHVEMMVWYYFNQRGKPLFRFLFYEKFGSYLLFKKHLQIINFDYLIDPMISPLREISVNFSPTPQELYDLWMNLIYSEPAGAFVAALLEFSYDPAIVIEGGDGKRRFGALDPPEPAALIVQRNAPRILGEPSDLSGKEMLFNKYHSLIPAYVRVVKAADGSPSLALFINADWEIKDGKAECKLILSVNMLNKQTLKSTQFTTAMTVTLANTGGIKATNKVPVIIDHVNGLTNFGPMKFHDLAKKLPAGDYVMDIDFFDIRTMKKHSDIKEFQK